MFRVFRYLNRYYQSLPFYKDLLLLLQPAVGGHLNIVSIKTHSIITVFFPLSIYQMRLKHFELSA